MPSGFVATASICRVACACSLALVVYVMVRAPLWNPVMAGGRAQLGSTSVALAPTVWTCSERPHICSTTVASGELVARVGAVGDRPIGCSASFRGQTIACNTWLWYAPRLKPFLELGQLPGVSFREAMLERPWRLLDLGLLGEQGPLPLWAGIACAFLLALSTRTLLRRAGTGRRVVLAVLTFVSLNAAWLLQCLLLGYID